MTISDIKDGRGYTTQPDTEEKVKELVLYYMDRVYSDLELLDVVTTEFEGNVNPAIVIEVIEDVKLRNNILQGVIKNLTEGETASDKLLIREMAESYSSIDNVNEIMKLIMKKTENRMNPSVVYEIINCVKYKDAHT